MIEDRYYRSLPNQAEKGTLEYRILQYLSTLDYPVSPSSMASFLVINPNSARTILSKLYRRGVIDRPTHGFYSIKPSYGVGSIVRPRVQNLRVCAVDVGDVVSDVDVLESDMCRVTLTFGSKRDKISYAVGAGLGLDPVGLSIAHGWVMREVAARGYCVSKDDWMVSSCEFLRDYAGLRLDGVKCVTFNDFNGNLEKYYNRPGVRNEVRVRLRGVGLQQLFGILDRGLDVGNVRQDVRELRDNVEILTEAVKGGNRINLNLTQVILDRFTKEENSTLPKTESEAS